MENLFNEIEIQKELKCYTPESLAWDLLVGEIDKEKQGKLLEFSDDDNKNPSVNDVLTFRYEILITIFMELLFDMAKLNFYADEKNENKNFIPKYKNFNIDAYVSVIQEKFEILGFLLHVDVENQIGLTDFEKEDLVKIINDRYCRVILRYNDKDEYFENNDVSENLYYHMKLNGLNNKKYKKMSDIYSVIILNEKIYKIYFDKL